MVKQMMVMGKLYQFCGQSHQFKIISPTLMRFYNLRGILTYSRETQIEDERGAWQEVSNANPNLWESLLP